MEADTDDRASEFNDGSDWGTARELRCRLSSIVIAALELNPEGPWKEEGEPARPLEEVKVELTGSLDELSAGLDSLSSSQLPNVHTTIAALVHSSQPNAFRHARTILADFISGLSDDALENLRNGASSLRDMKVQRLLKALEELSELEFQERHKQPQ